VICRVSDCGFPQEKRASLPCGADGSAHFSPQSGGRIVLPKGPLGVLAGEFMQALMEIAATSPQRSSHVGCMVALITLVG
jgi:hypothetical protein